ncbi:AAA family ATPase [Erythrobacter aureus]|uniref:AAA family ATPase n=1 Tax=Erythrobacter aureus TaxID=2182384 RepID=UPI003A8D0768
MHTVERIEIEGFRETHSNITLHFDDEVNFIIGRNGTGKTSLINLINAALCGDVQRLNRAPFEEITVRLKPRGSSRRPQIKYLKAPDVDGDEGLYFSVQAKSSDPVEFEEVEVDDLNWRLRYYERAASIAKRTWSEPTPIPHSNLREKIRKLVSTTWLSVHRSAELSEADHGREFESPVDQRLHHVFRKFGTYFSTLDKESAQITDKFQTNYFLSLISPPKVNVFAGGAQGISPQKERQALQEMFSEFGLTKSAYSSKLNAFIKQVEKAVKFQEDHENPAYPADVFLTLTDALRIDALVSEWAELLEGRAEIYSPKTDFLNIVNGLLYRKELKISAGNQPEFFNELGEVVSPDHLSSGEKQLLIILGEALIQKGQSYIFMADEPELSLHIDWQERLVPSLRQINPSSQIIFATHSPDIVGAYSEYTIDLEKVLG